MLYLTDKDGNLYGSQDGSRITYTKIDGVEFWYEYDKNGNWTIIKDKNGINQSCAYDNYNRWIYYVNHLTGVERVRRFDDFGNIVYYKLGYNESWYEYNNDNLLVYKKTRNTMTNSINEYRYVYDNNGNVVAFIDFTGKYLEIIKYKDGKAILWANSEDEYVNNPNLIDSRYFNIIPEIGLNIIKNEEIYNE